MVFPFWRGDVLGFPTSVFGGIPGGLDPLVRPAPWIRDFACCKKDRRGSAWPGSCADLGGVVQGHRLRKSGEARGGAGISATSGSARQIEPGTGQLTAGRG